MRRRTITWVPAVCAILMGCGGGTAQTPGPPVAQAPAPPASPPGGGGASQPPAPPTTRSGDCTPDIPIPSASSRTWPDSCSTGASDSLGTLTDVAGDVTLDQDGQT